MNQEHLELPALSSSAPASTELLPAPTSEWSWGAGHWATLQPTSARVAAGAGRRRKRLCRMPSPSGTRAAGAGGCRVPRWLAAHSRERPEL